VVPGDEQVTARLDAEKLETLRRWGAGLSDDGRDEVRAAGRAILLLIEEVEHLYVDLWHARATAAAAPIPALAPEPEPDPVEPVSESLLHRLRGLRARHAPAAPEANE
jgi:hypothetical protein